MQPKSGSADQLKPDPHAIPPTNIYSEPWWRSLGYNPVAPAMAGGNASNSSSLEGPNGGSDSSEGQSRSEEDDDVAKDSQATANHQSVGNHGREHMQLAASAVPVMHDECLTQPPQLELVGHSIACTSNPYQDPYYGGMVAAYGHQPVGYHPFVGMPQARMPLPLEMTQEPVYVNAKQYQGILRRRQARAKAELEKKLIKARKPYLHESRHQHAMRRARGTGGRFAKKNDNASNQTAEETGAGHHPALSSHSATSSGSEPLHSDSAENWNSSTTSREEIRPQVRDGRKFSNGSGHHQQSSAYRPHPGERGGEEGDCSGQQWGSISSNQSSQRPLAIQ